MRALVTGGGGFIGSHLVERLVGEGHEVTVLLQPHRPCPNPLPPTVRTVLADVRDADGLLPAVAGVEVVFHLAARTDLDGRSLHDYDTNVRGTENVVVAAEKHRVQRLVLVSSMLAVALTGRTDPIDETWTAENPTFYGRSKRQGERIVARAGVPWTIIRPTLVYGPRERATMGEFFRAVARRRFLLIGGDVWQSFVYVKNLVDGLVAASTCPGAEGEIFFVSDGRPYTLAEFARAAAAALGTGLPRVRLPVSVALALGWLLGAVHRVTGLPVPLTPRRVRTMTTHYVYSVDKARRLLGYRPTWGLEEAMRETAAWYRAMRLV